MLRKAPRETHIKKIFILFFWVFCLQNCMHTSSVPIADRGQKKVLNLLQLELWTSAYELPCGWVLGIKVGSTASTLSYLDCWVVFLPPNQVSLVVNLLLVIYHYICNQLFINPLHFKNTECFPENILKFSTLPNCRLHILASVNKNVLFPMKKGIPHIS